MTNTTLTLAELGWRPVIQQSLSLEQLETGTLVRILGVDRDQLLLQSEQSLWHEPLEKRWLNLPVDERPTVGDWAWLQPDVSNTLILLTRQTLLQRIASGSEPKPQVLAANVDTLLIVSSCNADFNKARLERYLALAMHAGVMPVIVLTKADLCETASDYQDTAQSLQATTPVVLVNALDRSAAEALNPWLATGQTLAILGSSGVGKTTLTNTLLGETRFATGDIREQDAKGRHTTTARQMVRIPDGAWIVDTPGMRELRLGDVGDGVDRVFEDIVQLTEQCRFHDCHHQGDLGCALEMAVEKGALDKDRLKRFLKLKRETDNAQQTIWERRQRYKAFGKMARKALKAKQWSKQ